MTPSTLTSLISSLQFPNAFNPYADFCESFDSKLAPKIRQKFLCDLLKSASKKEIESIWIGRDLGYRGGRRTGMALTDDMHANAYAARWGLEFKPCTKGDPVSERTATVIWDLLEQIPSNIFLWNVFPLHPHEPNSPFSNRQHNAAERMAGEAVLKELIHTLKPKRIVAIGNDAAKSCQRITGTIEVLCARHPSYGGQRDFENFIRKSYNIKETNSEQSGFDF